MEKRVIAVLLSLLIAACSIETIPVFAVETTSVEAVAAEEENTEREGVSEDTGDDEISIAAEVVSEEGSEGKTAVEEEEEPVVEIGEDAGVEEIRNVQTEPRNHAVTTEIVEIEEPLVIEEEIVAAEENEAVNAEDVVDSGKCGENAIWTLTGTGDDLTLTISGSGEMYDYEFYGNGQINSPWDSVKEKISTVIIEDGIIVIGENAFVDCRNMSSIALPESLTSIGGNAFMSCSSLTNITIPDGVTRIGLCVFMGCRNLVDVKLPDGIIFLNEDTFYGCSSLTNIIIPDSVKHIGNFLFCDCSSLESVSFGKNLMELPDHTFYGCTSLKKITIFDNVTSFDEDVFNPEDSIFADVYTVKGSAAVQYFSSLNSSDNNLSFTIHFLCDPTGHAYGSWMVVAEPSCEETGTRERVCSVCGDKETEVIPATGHTWTKDYTVDKEPTQTEVGSESKHCTICDAINEASIRVIPKLGFSVDANFVLEKPTFNYTGYPIEPGVTVTYNGSQLVKDQDYKVSYSNNIDLGEANVDVIGIGKYSGTEHLHFIIRIGAPKKVTCTNVASGMKVSWTKVNGATRYKVYRDGKHIFTTSALEVTDKEVKYMGGTKFVYKVVSTENKFGDSELFKTSTYYRLMPVGIKSVTNPSKGKMTVTYDKSKGCYGYVIRYGLKKDMSDANVVTVQGENMISRTFSGMKKGKTYYVQVRTYKLDNGVRYYSGYCTTKTITIRK